MNLVFFFFGISVFFPVASYAVDRPSGEEAAAATVADAEEDGLCNTSASSTLEIYAIGVFFLGASVRIGNGIGIRIVSIAFDSRTHSQ